MPNVLEIGGFLIDTERLVLALCVFAALGLARWLGGRLHIDRTAVTRAGEAITLGGLLAARAAFVWQQWPAYRGAPWTAMYFWQPGYDLWAGLIAGATIAMATVAMRQHQRRQFGTTLLLGLAGPFAIFVVFHMGQPWWNGTRFLGPGDRLPNARLQNLNSQPVSLDSLRGQPVVLNIWATWCGPCRREIPLLNRAYEQYKGRDLAIIGLDLAEPMATVQRFETEVPIAYPVWMDALIDPVSGASTTRALFDELGGQGVPTTVFIDRKGVIQAVQIGELSAGVLQQRITELLSVASVQRQPAAAWG